MQSGFQKQSRVRREIATQHIVEARNHFVRRNVGKKAETPAIDTKYGRPCLPGQAACIEHRAVAADGYKQVGIGKILFRKQVGPGVFQVLGNEAHRLGDPRVVLSPDDNNVSE